MAINWNLGDDGVLMIQGEGRMPDYGCGGRAMTPWNDARDQIRRIVVGDGIAEIGMRAFEGCKNLQSVELPESVVRIHARAFFDCKNLTQVGTAAKNTKFVYLNAPGLKAWNESRRQEKIARELAEQAEAANRKALKEQNEKEPQETESQKNTKELTPAEQREKNGQILLEMRKDKNGQPVLEVWKDKNGQILEVRTGKYGQIVEVRKNKNGQVLEVRKIKNGQVLKHRGDRSESALERQTAAGGNALKEQGAADGSLLKEQRLADGNSLKEQGFADRSLLKEQKSTDGNIAHRAAVRKRSLEDPEIRFGLNSFYNVPWARKKWGNFYIADGVLYACLSNEKKLTIPEGVHTLEKFAFKDTEVESLILPQSLIIIRAFAFADSKVQSLNIPDGVTKIEDYAFADSKLIFLEFSANSRCSVREATFLSSCFPYKKCAEGLPELFEVKAFQEKKKYGKFRQLRVVKKKVKSAKSADRGEEYLCEEMSRVEMGSAEKDGIRIEGDSTEKNSGSPKTVWKQKDDCTKNGVYGALRINVPRHLLRKMSTGSVILMIRCEEGRIKRLESFIWDKGEKLINEYLMYPCADEDGISIYRDSFTWQEKEDFLYAFDEEDATFLETQGCLRKQPEDCVEQWFWSGDRGNFGGPLELELLKYWLAVHSDRVDTIDECAKRFSGISFVYI